MTRKGKVADIFSKALYNDDPHLYHIGYQDFNDIKDTTLPDFLQISENFEIIPATRIVYIKKDNRVLYSKSMNKPHSDIR